MFYGLMPEINHDDDDDAAAADDDCMLMPYKDWRH